MRVYHGFNGSNCLKHLNISNLAEICKLCSKLIRRQTAFPKKDLTHLWASQYILIHIVYTAQVITSMYIHCGIKKFNLRGESKKKNKQKNPKKKKARTLDETRLSEH